jgi:branched-chain amino acid transport system permease protein
VARATRLSALSSAWGRLPKGAQRLLPIVVVLGLAATYPLYVDGLPTGIPVVEQFPTLFSAVVILVFTMMALGLNVVVGYAGLLDLGYVAFYAAGAYMAGWLASGQFRQVSFQLGAAGLGPDIPGIHISIWLVLIFAAIFTALVGIVIGLPTLRLRGDYLAIVTLGFGEIVPQFVRNGGDLKGFNLTGGTFGLSPIDAPGFGHALNDSIGLPVNFLQSFDKNKLFYWSILALILITVYCSVRLRDSRLGRAWIAIREDETAAAAMGVPLMRTKTWAYAIGAFFGGIAGAFYASFKSGAFPSDFYFNISIFLLCMVILGGIGSVWGVIVGGVVLSWLNIEGLANIGNSLGVQDAPKYQFGIYGLIVVLMMLFRPQGLIPERRRKRELQEGVLDRSLYEEREADEPGAGGRA